MLQGTYSNLCPCTEAANANWREGPFTTREVERGSRSGAYFTRKKGGGRQAFHGQAGGF